MAEDRRPFTHDDYTVGWICALPESELVVAGAVLDEEHPVLPAADPGDTNVYLLGRIGSHNVVIACLPAEKTGTVSAAVVAKDMLRSFTRIRFGLMVGVGGGVPGLDLDNRTDDEDEDSESLSNGKDIRLGDVVVSLHSKDSDAVVQYDFGKLLHNGQFFRTGSLNKPPNLLLQAVAMLKGQHMRKGHNLTYHLSKMLENNPKLKAKTYIHQGFSNDRLFNVDIHHIEGWKSCEACYGDSTTNLVLRKGRQDTSPRIHYGTIGSADQVMKDPFLRDMLAKKEKIICFEMEAAGLMDSFPCLVIRGICDYADSHKNDIWQPYAAATAAAYAKGLLLVIPGQAVAAMSPIEFILDAFVRRSDTIRRMDREESCLKGFHTTIYETQKNTNPPREPQTCLWFLENPRFLDWRDKSTSCLLWVTAPPGCGKSVLSRALVDERLLESEPEDAIICYFFFKDTSDDQRSATSALAALLHQVFLSDRGAALIKHALPKHAQYKEISSHFDVMWSIIEEIAMDPESGKIFFLLDALDECETSARNKLIGKLKALECRKTTKTSLKVLVTSRPYPEVEAEFKSLIKDILSIELRGEDESKTIRNEIDYVIKTEIDKLPREIFAPPEARHQLLQHLLAVENRTYLWIHLILGIIKKEQRIDASKIADFNIIPDTLEKTYEAILDKIEKSEIAIRLLRIVVAAYRPLTLKEMEVALYIQDDIRSEKDLILQGENQFEITVRDLCGLFVSIIDNRIFLIHQTAKDYLVKHRAFKPRESNLILSKSCIWYLRLEEFETHPLVMVDGVSGWNRQARIDRYTGKHYFLDYSAKHWAAHFQRANVKETTVLKQALEVCETRSKRFLTWFQVYWITFDFFSQCPPNLTCLMVASHFGHKAVVKSLLHRDAQVDTKDEQYGRTPLSWAAGNGHDEVVKLLLKNRAQVDSKDNGGQTPLSWSARNGHSEVVKLLLEKRAQVDSKDKYGWTPLSWAASNGHDEVVKLLLKNRAQVNPKDNYGWTPLLRAAERGHKAVVKSLLHRDAQVDTKDKQYGRTSLSRAAGNGHDEAVKLLLKNRAQIDSKDNSGQTPLSWSARNGHSEAAKLLFEKRAQVDSKDKYGWTPLSWAARNGHDEVVKLLFENRAQVDSTDKRDQTPLSWAAGNGHDGVVKLLLEERAQVDSKDETGKTPLSMAAARGHVAVVKLLLKSRAQIESKDNYGKTPISLAVANKHEAVVQLLLKKGAQVDSEDEDWNGQTPLRRAAVRANEVAMKLLIEKGAQVDFQDENGQAILSLAMTDGFQTVVKLLLEKGAPLNFQHRSGQTLLSWAMENGHEAIIELLLKKGIQIDLQGESGQSSLWLAMKYGSQAIMRFLFEKGAQVDVKDEQYGRTPLSWAAAYGHEAVIKLLLENSAQVDFKDKNGWTPLLLAAARGRQAVLKLLLEKGAQVDSKDETDRTPLSWAAARGHSAVVKLLLEKGAQVDSEDENGQTPLSWAAANGHDEVVKLILKKHAQADYVKATRTLAILIPNTIITLM